MTSVNSSLNLAGRSQTHHQVATNFQGLRRETEEELVRCRASTIEDSYAHIISRWTEALEAAPPLPPDIHKSVKWDIDSVHKE